MKDKVNEVLIYAFPIELIAENDAFNPFEPSDWNDMDKLPEQAIKAIVWSKKNDFIYTPYNFMIDFNTGNTDTVYELNEMLLFVPDPKFWDEIKILEKTLNFELL